MMRVAMPSSSVGGLKRMGTCFSVSSLILRDFRRCGGKCSPRCRRVAGSSKGRIRLTESQILMREARKATSNTPTFITRSTGFSHFTRSLIAARSWTCLSGFAAAR